MLSFDDSPIIACSSGTATNVAISIIRLSFLKDFDFLNEFFSLNLNSLKPRFATYTDLLFDNEVVDKIVLIYFKAPETFNGENILELHVHGNQIHVDNIISEMISRTSVRLALPGEFTFRALKNKKMTLSQVEGLDLFLNANSSVMLKNGLQGLGGEIEFVYQNLFNAFVRLKSSLELNIDFSEDIGDEEGRSLFENSLLELTNIVDGLHRRSQGALDSILSPSIVLTGRTNAGKSSLFNLILGEARSIVSSIAGTTRDYVSESFFYEGVSFKLIDTAGLRELKNEAVDAIEAIGMERSLEMLSKAFFKILLINPFDEEEIHFDLMSQDFDLVLFTHADYPTFFSQLSSLELRVKGEKFFYSSLDFLKNGSIGPKKSGPIEPHPVFGPIEPLLNVKQLIEIIVKKFKKVVEDDPILIQRQRICINNIYLLLSDFNKLYSLEKDVGILSSELKVLEREISKLIGVLTPDDILNNIFANFCIGK